MATSTLAANPAPNTTLTIPSVATVILNRQTTAGDGTLTVTAIYVNLLGAPRRWTIGTSRVQRREPGAGADPARQVA